MLYRNINFIKKLYSFLLKLGRLDKIRLQKGNNIKIPPNGIWVNGRPTIYWYEAMERYNLARKFIKDNDFVLDAGCNYGYGSNCLADVAKAVVGIDILKEGIAWASKNYHQNKLKFLVADLKCIPFYNSAFDIIVSFEVIEHIVDYHKYLTEIKRLLKPEGIFIISTPYQTIPPRKELLNPEHIREFIKDEFLEILSKYFIISQLYFQRRDSALLSTDKSILRKTILRLDFLNLRNVLPQRHKNYIASKLGLVTLDMLDKHQDYFKPIQQEDKETIVQIAICRQNGI